MTKRLAPYLFDPLPGDPHEAAVAWTVRLSEEADNPAVLDEFEEWRRADPAHASAFKEAERLSGRLARLNDYRHESAVAAMAEPLLREKVIAFFHRVAAYMRTSFATPLRAGGAGVAMAALIAIVLFAAYEPIDPARPDHATMIAEIRDVSLEDGSVVTLGAATAMHVRFTEEERRVHLGFGEAFFSIAHEETRPFFVEAGDTVVRVVGTKFDVRRSQAQVSISVAEGTVEVRPVAAVAESIPPPAEVLMAGERLTTSSEYESFRVGDAAKETPGAWRSGRLSYDGAPLKEVVFDANRYFSGDLIIASDVIADLEVTTSYSVDQVETMIRSLEFILPLRAEYLQDGGVILHPVSDGSAG